MNGKVIWCAWGAVATGLLVLLIYLLLAAFGGYFSGPTLDLSWAAHIGTFVGGTVGALWALAGVFFFYAALKVQEESLKSLSDSVQKQEEALVTQKEELRVTRKEYKLQREEMELTRKIFERQAFDGTFFNLIEQKRDLENRMHNDGDKNAKTIVHARDLAQEELRKSLDGKNRTSEKSYRLGKPFIEIIQVLMDFISESDWGEIRIKGQKNMVQALVEGLEAKFKNGTNNFLFGQLDEVIRDKRAYASILSGTTAPEGRVLFFYYVCTCNDKYKRPALELGFFDGLSIGEFSHSDDYKLCEYMEERDGLIYYKPHQKSA